MGNNPQNPTPGTRRQDQGLANERSIHQAKCPVKAFYRAFPQLLGSKFVLARQPTNKCLTWSSCWFHLGPAPDLPTRLHEALEGYLMPKGHQRNSTSGKLIFINSASTFPGQGFPVGPQITNERLGFYVGRRLWAFYYALENRTPLLLLWLIEYSGLAPNNLGIPSRSQILVYHHVTTSHRVITEHEYVQA
ncbi:hypothetical protein VNO77_03658 [Canavalia gladiata]|uniref:Uncharacterized protein n=1 Tax=Canavalia gladiata TaxID=3824 RepID=A0AAN9N078_CANGL